MDFNNNIPYFDFTKSNQYLGNLTTKTRDTKMKRAMVKMGNPVGSYGALQMTSAGTETRNAAILRRQCLTKDDLVGMYRDRVGPNLLIRLEGAEQIDKGSPKNPNFLQRLWKAIVNSPSSFLVPLTEMLEPIITSKDTPEKVKNSAKTVLFFSKLYLGQQKTRPDNMLFDQLVGLDEPKRQMRLIVSRILGSGGSNKLTPTAVLLHGPAQTGKTSLVHALAKQADVTFIPVTGEELTQDEKGNGRLKSIFSEARVGAPSIIFIHGVEAVKAVTQLVHQMIRCKKDGVVVMVVATTVSADKVSPKFMKKITIECCLAKPDLETRIQMAEVLLKNLNVVEEDRETIHNYLAYETSGFVWSDLELVCDNSLALAKYQGDVAVLVTKEHVSESLTAVKALHVLQNASEESEKNKVSKDGKKSKDGNREDS